MPSSLSKEDNARRVKKWRDDNPDKFKDQILRRLYGVSLSEVDLSICEICGKQYTSGRSFHIDHDHESGAIRGVLCHTCNLGLGAFGDSPALLIEAANYLMTYGRSF